ncbi:MAG: ImmA/IrrE family metallo-endopeptidase [Alphaproteobacteria bacterium]|nr:ImmA/IrrE family metallo-endopeptidase [Alphaproteobacteria bacterium]
MKEMERATPTNQFIPNYAIPPGAVLAEHLDVHELSHTEFARRCGRSQKLISDIIAGKAPLEPETALQFEKVLGVDASIWLAIEGEYKLHRAREAEAHSASELSAWVGRFPLRHLVARGLIQQPKTEAEAVSRLLAFFRVGSVDAWHQQYRKATVAYRHSSRVKSDDVALATWLRLGELEAEAQECSEYHEPTFRQALKDIRKLTRLEIKHALSESRRLCNQAGVALAIVESVPKTALSGAAWWLTPRKAIIELSGRHKSDDHLWFSFFHEAAHILLHSKKHVFADENTRNDSSKIEAEANAWAEAILVPRNQWAEFVASTPRNEQMVRRFAEQQGIAPGIIVGMLQHHGHLPWTHLNNLKVKLG